MNLSVSEGGIEREGAAPFSQPPLGCIVRKTRRPAHTALAKNERGARGREVPVEEQLTAAAAAPPSKAAGRSTITADSSSYVLISVMPLTKLEVTLLEVAKAHLRDGFLIAQPTLTHALKAIS